MLSLRNTIHELSITESIVKIALDRANEEQASKIYEIKLVLGELSGFVPSLMAVMLEEAIKNMPLDDIDLLLVEKVGNLVCPPEFILGEHKRVVISSLLEGDDKYPVIVHRCRCSHHKQDRFCAYVEFDLTGFRSAARGLNPDIKSSSRSPARPAR